MKRRLSLKGKGLQLLSQREHSRHELRRKLLAYARKEVLQALDARSSSGGAFADEPAGAATGTATGSASDDVNTAVPTPEEEVDAVLDWLQAQRYLSNERFVESRVHARASRFGNLRIRQELAQHGVELSVDEARALKDSEVSRARSTWQRKFGHPPVDAAERGRQMRFLAGRGFTPEVIRRVVQGSDDD